MSTAKPSSLEAKFQQYGGNAVVLLRNAPTGG